MAAAKSAGLIYGLAEIKSIAAACLLCVKGSRLGLRGEILLVFILYLTNARLSLISNLFRFGAFMPSCAILRFFSIFLKTSVSFISI